jgi:hypothetical protein
LTQRHPHTFDSSESIPWVEVLPALQKRDEVRDADGRDLLTRLRERAMSGVLEYSARAPARDTPNRTEKSTDELSYRLPFVEPTYDPFLREIVADTDFGDRHRTTQR